MKLDFLKKINYSNLLSFLIKASVYSLVFLIPLFWLPFSFEAFEFNKQYLLIFLTSFAFFIWLLREVTREKTIKIIKSLFYIFIFLFLLSALLSIIFSVDKTSSLFGTYGRFNNGIILLITLIIFCFLIAQNTTFSKEEENKIKINTLINVFFLSLFFVLLISYFSLFGIFAKIGQFTHLKLPPLITQKGFNPTGASFQELVVFLAVSVVLLAGKILKEGMTPFKGILLFFSFVLLAIGDFDLAWIILLISSLFLIGIFLKRKILSPEKVNRLLIPISIIFLSLAFLFLNLPLAFNIPSLNNTVLAPSPSFEIAFKAIKDNTKALLFGSGIGTFYYDFIKFKSPEFGLLRIERAPQIPEIIATLGILGTFSYLLLIFGFLFIFWRRVFSKKEEDLELITLRVILLSVFIALITGQFLFYQNTLLNFIFWLVLGMGIAVFQKEKEVSLSLKESPEFYLVGSSLLIILALLIGVGFFYLGRFYLADVNYREGLKNQKAEKLEKAITLNPYQTYYQLTLANYYFNSVLPEIQNLPSGKTVPMPAIKKLQKSIELLKELTDKKVPNQVAAWESLARIYINLQNLGTTDAIKFGISSLEKAIDLEPTNFVFHTELGKLYSISGETKRAKSEINKALNLNQDYLDANLQMALIAEKENQTQKAISMLEKMVKKYPLYPELLFQLGRLYFNQGETDKAISLFQRVISIAPNHSNSLFALGLAYEKKGDKKKALFYFESVLKLNPNNLEVKKKVEKLRSKGETETKKEKKTP